MKKGFTLAEVLITLGIIGVISALTMPTLIKNVANQKTGPALLKAVNTFSKGNENMFAGRDISRISMAGISTETLKYTGVSAGENSKLIYLNEAQYANLLTNYIDMTLYDAGSACNSYNEGITTEEFQGECPTKKYGVGGKNGTSSISVTDYNGGSIHDIQLTDEILGETDDNSIIVSNCSTAADAIETGQKYLTNDGMIYIIKVMQYPKDETVSPVKQLVGMFFVDINGPAKPNSLGRDVFAFTLWNNGSLKPVGGHGWKGGGENDNDLWVTKCNSDSNTIYGLYCAGSIFENDKKIIYQ